MTLESHRGYVPSIETEDSSEVMVQDFLKTLANQLVDNYKTVNTTWMEYLSADEEAKEVLEDLLLEKDITELILNFKTYLAQEAALLEKKFGDSPKLRDIQIKIGKPGFAEDVIAFLTKKIRNRRMN